MATPPDSSPPLTVQTSLGTAHSTPARRGPLALPPQIARTMRLSIAEGGFTQVFLNWTTGSVLVGYMLHFGASPTELALVASVPLLAQTVSPFAAYLAGLAGRRKYLTAGAAALGRALWVLAALLPQLAVPANERAAFLVLLVACSSLFQAAAGSLWASWMGDVVPDGRRGRYFGLRAGMVGAAGMVANLVAGWFLDKVAAPLSFQLIIGVAVLCAAVGVYLYFLHYEPPVVSSRLSFRDTFVVPWRDANFRRFLLFAVYWQMAVQVGSPFVVPYFLEQLHMTFMHVAFWSVISASCALATTSLWGRVADRYGNKAVLAIGTFLAGMLLPSCWILAGLTGHLWFIWLSAVFDATAWGAINPAIFNLALVSAPKADRLAFIAMYSLAAGLAGFLGGVLSGPLLTLFLSLGFSAFGLHWTGYYTLFLVSGASRAQAWRLLRPVQETNAWRTRDVLQRVRYAWRGMGFPWR